jgi:hypothetical protein
MVPLTITPHLSQPHFGLSVRVKPTLPKVGSWSPPGLPKTQSSIAGVKSPRNWMFLVSLKRSWSVDVQNGLAWAIWTSAAQVMGKRRAGSQHLASTSPWVVAPITKVFVVGLNEKIKIH